MSAVDKLADNLIESAKEAYDAEDRFQRAVAGMDLYTLLLECIDEARDNG